MKRKGLFRARICRNFDLLSLGSFFCYFDLKPLISLSFLPSADFVAGEFTVYKKSRIDPHDLSIS
jgi:hypothetical protein